MGEDSCYWFQWVFEDLTPNPSTLPQTSSPLKHRRSPSIKPSPSSPPQTSSSLKRRCSASIKVSSPSPTLGHARKHQQIVPLLYAQRHASSSRGSSKRHALNLSPSLPPQHHCTPSIKHAQPPRVWPFDFYANEMDIGFKKCHLSPISISLSRGSFQTISMSSLPGQPFMITVTIGWALVSQFMSSTLGMGILSVAAGQLFCTKRSEVRG